MTSREKAICEAYTGICFLTGNDRNEFYKYISEIYGRPIFTHELLELAGMIKQLSKEDFVRVCRGDFDETKGLLPFGSRMQLAKKYHEWIAANHVEDCALSVITYLHIEGLLNVEKTMQKNCREFGMRKLVDDWDIKDDFTEENLADYILADGWIRPPVKIGQELWEIHYNRPRKWEVVYLGYNGKEWFINVHWWKDRHNFATKQITYPFLGKMWYFSKEEAEQALQEKKI